MSTDDDNTAAMVTDLTTATDLIHAVAAKPAAPRRGWIAPQGGMTGTVDLTVFPAQRADECQRGRCRDDDDTERYDREEEARALS